MKHSILVTFLFLLPGLSVRAESPAFQVADLGNPVSMGTDPRGIIMDDSHIYFWGWTPATGRELFVSDGTREGTGLLLDFCPGTCSTEPRAPNLVILDDALFFAVCRAYSCGLWRYAAGEPTKIFDGFVEELTGWNGELYFTTEDDELRKLERDGQLTLLLGPDDLPPPPPWPRRGETVPKQLRSAEEALFFVLGTPFGQLSPPIPEDGDVWRTDGTREGTFEVADIFQPNLFSFTLGSRLLLEAKTTDDPTSRYYLASSAGIELFFDDPPFGLSHPIAAIDGVLFVEETTGQAWRSDGTPNGTAPLNGGLPGPTTFLRGVAHEGELFFALRSKAAVLRRTVDLGAPSGSTTVVETFPEAIRLLESVDGRLFVGTGTSRPDHLWELTESGRSLVLSLSRGFFLSLFSFAGDLFFVRGGARDATGELGRIDSNGFELLTAGYATESMLTRDLVAHRDSVFFKDGIGRAWWSDGTLQGTFPLGDPRFSLSTFRASSLDGEGYFRADRKLHRFTTGGDFAEIFEIPAEEQLFIGEVVFKASGALHFLTADAEGAVDLWQLAGDFAGAERVIAGLHTVTDRRAIQTAWNDEHALVLIDESAYLTDGTTVGTRQILDIAVVCDCRLDEPAVAGDFYFTSAPRDASTPDRRRRLWRTTTAGESGIVREWDGDPRVAELTGMGDRLFFVGPGAGTGSSELWTSDGTAEGTRLVVGVRPGPEGSKPQALAAVDGLLLFAADDGVRGLEPWAAVSTEDGGVNACLVQDVRPGPQPSAPAAFTAAAELVFFNTGTPELGFELWALPRPALVGLARKCVLSAAIRRALQSTN